MLLLRTNRNWQTTEIVDAVASKPTELNEAKISHQEDEYKLRKKKDYTQHKLKLQSRVLGRSINECIHPSTRVRCFRDSISFSLLLGAATQNQMKKIQKKNIRLI